MIVYGFTPHPLPLLGDIYTHLDYSNKISSANAILGVYPNTFRVGAVGQ